MLLFFVSIMALFVIFLYYHLQITLKFVIYGLKRENYIYVLGLPSDTQIGLEHVKKNLRTIFYEHAEAPPPSLTVVKDSTVIFVYPFPYCFECCLVFSSSITNYYYFVRKLQTLLQSNNLSCCPSLISHFPFHGCYIKFLNIEHNFFS